jgi:hypothetical protein
MRAHVKRKKRSQRRHGRLVKDLAATTTPDQPERMSNLFFVVEKEVNVLLFVS